MVRRGLAIAVLLIAGYRVLSAQTVLVWDRSRTEVGARGSGTSSGEASQDLRQGWLKLRAWGSLFSPDLLGFGLGLQPGFTSTRYAHPLGRGGSDDRLLGTDGYVDLLRRRAVSGSLRWLRLAHDQSGRGGYLGDVGGQSAVLESWLRYDNRLMPLRLEYRDENWTQQSQLGGEVQRTRASLETVRLSGRNRKTGFQLERRVTREPEPLTYRQASIENRQAWGKGSTFEVAASALDQQSARLGTASNTQWGLGLHLQHLRTVWSDWSVSRWGSHAGDQRTARTVASGGIGTQILANLTGGLAASLASTRYDQLEEASRRIESRLAARVRLPAGAWLGVSGSAGYEHLEISRGQSAWVTVVGEAHRLDASGSLLLTRPEVDPGTLLVTGPDGSVLIRGLDYEITEAGGAIQIVLLPGSRVKPGETVTVTYRFRVAPTAAAPSFVGSYSADVQIRGLRLYHRRLIRNPQTERSTDPALAGIPEVDWVTSGAQLLLASKPVRTTLQAERQSRTDGGGPATVSSVTGTLGVWPHRRIRASVQGGYQLTEAGAGRYRLATGRSSVEWLASSAWVLEGASSFWHGLERDSIRRRELGFAGRLTWQPGLLRVVVSYQFRDWRERMLLGPTSRTLGTSRWDIEIVRTF